MLTDISRNRKRAFSLLEVILTVGLFALVVVGLLVVFEGGLKLLEQAEQAETASSIARQELEQIKLGATVDGVFDGSIPTPPVSGFPPAPYPALTRNRPYSLIVRSTSTSSRLRRIDVEVHDGPRTVITMSSVFLK